MTDELEAPGDPEDLYLARGDEVVLARPLMTGDVLSEIEIPGVEGDPGTAIIITHPCSMRRDGVNLVERLLFARVGPYQQLTPEQWAGGHWKVMPLPQLLGEGDHSAARLDLIGLVSSAALDASSRIASLSPYGVNLLQQRFIWHLTRFCVPTFRLNEACAAVFEEAELHEDWVSARMEAGVDALDAAKEFHDWIRDEDTDAVRRQEHLADPPTTCVASCSTSCRRNRRPPWPTPSRRSRQASAITTGSAPTAPAACIDDSHRRPDRTYDEDALSQLHETAERGRYPSRDELIDHSGTTMRRASAGRPARA